MKKVFVLFTFAVAAIAWIFGPQNTEVKDKTAKTELVTPSATETAAAPTLTSVTYQPHTLALTKTDAPCCAPACHSASPPTLPALYNSSGGIKTSDKNVTCPAGFDDGNYSVNSNFNGGGLNKTKAVSAVVLKPAWCGATLTHTKADATKDIAVLRLEMS